MSATALISAGTETQEEKKMVIYSTKAWRWQFVSSPSLDVAEDEPVSKGLATATAASAAKGVSFWLGPSQKLLESDSSAKSNAGSGL